MSLKFKRRTFVGMFGFRFHWLAAAEVLFGPVWAMHEEDIYEDVAQVESSKKRYTPNLNLLLTSLKRSFNSMARLHYSGLVDPSVETPTVPTTVTLGTFLGPLLHLHSILIKTRWRSSKTKTNFLFLLRLLSTFAGLWEDTLSKNTKWYSSL